jgi:hypothetical protein
MSTINKKHHSCHELTPTATEKRGRAGQISCCTPSSCRRSRNPSGILSESLWRRIYEESLTCLSYPYCCHHALLSLCDVGSTRSHSHVCLTHIDASMLSYLGRPYGARTLAISPTFGRPPSVQSTLIKCQQVERAERATRGAKRGETCFSWTSLDYE